MLDLLRNLKICVSGIISPFHLLILKYKEILSEIKTVMDLLWMGFIFKELES